MADTRDQVLAVRIFGKEYHLARDPDKTVDHIRQVAALVDEKMRLIAQDHEAQSAFHTALLAGLDLVDALFQLRDEFDSAQSDIAGRTSRLSESLGRILEGSSVEWTSKEEGVSRSRPDEPILHPASTTTHSISSPNPARGKS